MPLVEITFWVAIALVAYAYAGYPVIIYILSRLRVPRPRADIATRSDWPQVTLVIAAYREETVIAERVKNALALDYPADRFEIIIGCDGKEDGTGEIVAGFDDPRLRLEQFPKRRGKASVLNDCVPMAKGEIIAFSDANTMMQPDAIKLLVRHFEDESVGGVVGNLQLVDSETGANADSVYWRYENMLKRCEGRVGALLGANGAIYAIRKLLYEPIPANTIIDDFLIGMRIHEHKRALLYDAEAIAIEETAPSIGGEFHRRARIGAGGFQSLFWLLGLLSPTRPVLAFAFWSHKVMRWLCPLFLIVAAVANSALAVQDSRYGCLLVLHALFYASAWVGGRITAGGPLKLFRIVAMFVGMNAALAVGFWRWISGAQGGAWKRTERQ
jgi:cellulose synthase/poly-beta-1,6-N-acetylglucosamine synthase-like glycosyltransferase